MKRRFLAAALPCLAASGLSRPAVAQQAWPSRPARIVVVFPPGGASDIAARVLAEALSARMGALRGGRPRRRRRHHGAAHVAQQPPDGYTLMLSNTAPIVTSPPPYARPGYDPVRGFTHIAWLGTTPAVIIAGVVPAADFAGLVA